jgi:two-component system cell cycle sensor histidine kinase/response regulator CckA
VKSQAYFYQLCLRVAERTEKLEQANDSLRAEIEQRKVIEDELLQARKMEAIGVLAGGIAHDFNNFLTVVLGGTSLAKELTQPGNPVYEILEQINAACARAAALASQLLTFSKGGAPVRRVGSVAQLLRESVDLARAGSPVGIDLAVDDDLRAAEFDAGQMSQVLHNILLNARQAMPEGGVVEVRAGNVTVGEGHPLMRPGSYVRISVRDHGSGISQENLPRIFDPYFTTREAGSGLGLAAAYSIVTKHQGHIGVHTEEGAGSTFTIDLPAAEHAPTPQPERRGVIQSGSGRILVMDDEMAILKLLARLLEGLGYEVECASDGAEAVVLYERARLSGRGFAAVLADLTVAGGMGGKETASRLREIDPSVRIIVSSGHSDSAILSDFQKYGFSDVLPKPWSLVRLSEVLKRVLSE